MALSQEELFKLDLYDLLGLETKCSLQEVKRAFRKKALKCHPDKNPDDPNAAQLFHQLSCALEILSDESARAAYDKVLNARKAAHIRNQQLDSRRKKLKEDLEERERNANRTSGTIFKNEEMKLKAEIERLRKEGSRLLQEEISKVNEQIHRVQEQLHFSKYSKSKFSDSECGSDSGNTCFTVRWKVEKGDVESAGYSYNVLHGLLSKYGEISTLILSAKRRGRAVVEFKKYDASILQAEIGFPGNILSIESVKGADPPKKSPPTSCHPNSAQPNESLKKANVFPSFSATNNQLRTDDLVSSKWSLGKTSSREKDEMLELSVLQRLREMERMKRAAEENSDKK